MLDHVRQARLGDAVFGQNRANHMLNRHGGEGNDGTPLFRFRWGWVGEHAPCHSLREEKLCTQIDRDAAIKTLRRHVENVAA